MAHGPTRMVYANRPIVA